MIAVLLLLLLADQTPVSGPKPPVDPARTLADRYNNCIDLATGDPAKGETEATFWHRDGGRFLARQCLGIALANQGRWLAAAGEFEDAAQEAEVVHDNRAAYFWAQAGNAWLATKNTVKARRALDAALAAGTLETTQRGEALFDRARSMVASGDLAGARADIDAALALVKQDPLIWLASATLARKMNDLPRAKIDVAEAFRQATDDAAVYLEVGNIAAAAGDESGAKAAWNDAVRIAPDSNAGRSARVALKQFDNPAASATPKP